MKRFILLLLTLLGTSAIYVSAQGTEWNVSGKFVTNDGKAVAGVVVTDGYTVVATDENGEYHFNRNAEAAYVYFSVPENYEVPLRNGSPCFYKKLTDAREYDFVLTPLRKGVEKDFTLFCMADPQCQNNRHVYRYRTESAPDIKASVRKCKTPCYGVTLGDIAYSQGPRNATYLLPILKEEMRVEKLGMPVFQTIGNHDNEMQPVALNDNNLTPTTRMQRTFESVFGPINYSWNRGDVHIVSMSDIVYHSVENQKHHGDFLDKDVEWLEKDLSFVPKNKLVLLCLHIPMAEVQKRENGKRVMALLEQFDNCHIMSGHTHYNRNVVHSNGIYEHIHAAVSGGWWWSQNNGDGTPNGYAIYDIRGNRIVDWNYKSVGYPLSHQLRLYRGNAEFGGEYEKLKLPFGEKVILANVWNADEQWKIEVYENGKLSGEMKRMKTSPYRGDEFPSVESSKDWWAIGYHVGVVGRGHFNGSTRKNYCAPCHHMYKYTLKDPTAKIKVVATDSHGRKFTCDRVIEGAEYETAAPPTPPTDCEIW